MANCPALIPWRVGVGAEWSTEIVYFSSSNEFVIRLLNSVHSFSNGEPDSDVNLLAPEESLISRS